MIERLNRMMTQSLRACINDQKDWIVVLQSIAMSYRSTRHDSTGKSPYEMMFGCPMRLPFELKMNPITGIPQHVNNEDLGEILTQDTREELVEKFKTIDKIRGVIHDAATDEIARSQLKQAKYYDSRHCGSKLSVGDKVLHYNRKAAQRQGDKTAPQWLDPYTIVKVHDKGNYTVMDKNGKQLATKVCASNHKMWHEPMNSDLLPDWIKPSQIPDPAEVVQEQLDESKKNKKAKRKKEALKKAKPNAYLKKLYGDNLPLPPCDRQDSSTEFITPNVFKREREESSDDQSEKPSQRVHFTDNISVHTFPKCTSEKKEADKEIRKEELKAKLKEMKKKKEMEGKRELKEKKDKFFSDMLPDYREDENVQNRSNCSDGSDCEIVQSVQNSDFTFDPLTPNVRKAICDRLSMPFHKADLKHDNIGEKLFN